VTVLTRYILKPGSVLTFKPVVPLAVLDGTEDRDSLVGGTGDDSIRSFGLSDTVSGLGGNDTIDLGDGNDFYGVKSASGAVLETGNDKVSGGAGDDVLADWSGANSLVGGTGNDVLSGAFGGVTLDTAADVLKGNDGNDTLTGNYGDTLTGGNGADLFGLEPGGKAVVINDFQAQAGDSIQIYVPDDSTADMLGQLGYGTAPNGRDLSITLGGVLIATLRDAAGQAPDIEIINSDFINSTVGAGLNDTLTGTSGDDLVFGGSGDDSLNAGGGDDFVNDGWGNDYVQLGSGNDIFHGSDYNPGGIAFVDDIHGGSGNDQIQTWTGANTVHGDDGNDYVDVWDISGQTGKVVDVVSGGKGNDTIFANAGDTISGDSGADLFWVDGDGAVTVKDFTVGEDLLQLGFGLIGTLNTTNGHDAFVQVNGVTVAVLQGVDYSTVTLADILL
jgi:Ca2+-binding RTX toxin-like protein